MTYKELVNNIKQIVQDHYMLVDFGYGQISDIKTGGDDGEADYPYAFLNPGSHTRGERSITYRFNLIVMDMYLGDDFLTAQSQCQQYIDDILAEMKYGTQNYDININATLTPFKERFQDVVGGMTATLEIEVGQKLNLCIAPINNETLINRVFVNVEECPAYDTAFDIVSDVPNFPDYPKQFNEFYARFDEPAPFENCNNGKTPLAINSRNSTTEPYYNAGSRRWKIPAGVGGVFHLDFDLLLKNAQGIDLSEDRLWIQLVINGQTQTYYDLPELPIDGTPVAFNQRFTVDASSDDDEFTILFRYADGGTPAPDGPLVGYTGTAEIYRVGDPVITPPTPPTPPELLDVELSSSIIPGGFVDPIPFDTVNSDLSNLWDPVTYKYGLTNESNYTFNANFTGTFTGDNPPILTFRSQQSNLPYPNGGVTRQSTDLGNGNWELVEADIPYTFLGLNEYAFVTISGSGASTVDTIDTGRLKINVA